ncbi:NAD(P)/FAD-dependent oxidoreductase [Silvibacterium sp.]|uniref:NAD(P)/FAD-dependent oxidoreductase n=1 Tax=Silvibacterium sp. TaxID=1964179 RepID=UPI0039E3D345
MLDAVVIGAGLAGLNCALTLERAGLNVALLEAQDGPGGRVRTDVVDGFRLDRGFQILLTAYPEAQRALDYERLKLCPMTPGALVWHEGAMHRLADPFRHPLLALGSLLDGTVPLGDKLKVASLREKVKQGEIEEIFAAPETTTLEFLRQYGFSEAMIERFFRPFFSGVFSEPGLKSSSRYFQFLFRMFAEGPAAVPELGMGEIPAQLAAALKPETLSLSTRVVRLEKLPQGYRLKIEDGREIEARTVVAAAGAHTLPLVGLSGLAAPGNGVTWNQTVTVYFTAERAPVEEPTLVLNGVGQEDGPINHLTVMSCVSKAYAPPGAELIAANVVGQAPLRDLDLERLEAAVRGHARRIFGAPVDRWRRLRTYAIPHALPLAAHVMWNPQPVQRTSEGVYLCGDVTETPSIQGALVSGRRVAEALLASD